MRKIYAHGYRVVGFEELGNTDGFTTAQLEARLTWKGEYWCLCLDATHSQVSFASKIPKTRLGQPFSALQNLHRTMKMNGTLMSNILYL